MLAGAWLKNCHDNVFKVKLQNFSSQNHRQKSGFCSAKKPLLQCDSSLQATYLENVSAKALKLWFFLKQFSFSVLFHDARTVLLYHLCSSFSLEKKLPRYSIILSIPVVSKIYAYALKGFILFQ